MNVGLAYRLANGVGGKSIRCEQRGANGPIQLGFELVAGNITRVRRRAADPRDAIGIDLENKPFHGVSRVGGGSPRRINARHVNACNSHI